MAADGGDLCSLVDSGGVARGFKLDAAAFDGAICIEVLHEDAAISRAVNAVPGNDVFTGRAHANNLRIVIIAIS